MPAEKRPFSVAATVVVVAAIATLVQAGLFVSSCLWVAPDSAAYITLAAGIAERWDFGNPLFQFRLPGYPLMLAAVFRVFGEQSAVALPVLQHMMVAACAVLTVLIAHRLRPARGFVLLVALPATISLHLSGYANAVLTEVPYTLLLLGFVYLLLRFMAGGGRVCLVAASLSAGVLALFRDSGQFFLIVGVIVAMGVTWKRSHRTRDRLPHHPSDGATVRWRRMAMTCALAAAPGMLMLAPFMLHHQRAFGGWAINCNRDLLPYYRAACVERLDAPNSAALAEVRAALVAAQADGVVSANATIHDYLPTVRAVQHRFDPQSDVTFASARLADVADLLNRAGWDIIRAHPGPIALGTLRHAKHLVFTPDDAYRVLPGSADVHVRSPDAHTAFVAQRVGPEIMSRYLPLDQEPLRLGSPVSAVVSTYHARVEHPCRLTGANISLYEWVVLLAVLGGIVSLAAQPRAGWWLIAIVIGYHVVGAGFMGGREPRYVVPVLPLMTLWLAVALWGSLSALRWTVRRANTREATTPEGGHRDLAGASVGAR